MSNRKRPRGRPSKYPPEFQRDAVAMVLDEGRPIAEVARAIGVNEGTLGNWVAKARGNGRPVSGLERRRAGRAGRAARRGARSCGWSVMSSSDPWSCG